MAPHPMPAQVRAMVLLPQTLWLTEYEGLLDGEPMVLAHLRVGDGPLHHHGAPALWVARADVAKLLEVV